ncbi:MAG: Ig-like domain-containing protein [Gemmatales bacterium]
MMKTRRFMPDFDHLEARDVPAGNITASLHHGILTITGDNEANQLSITGNGYSLTLTGTDTTINGVTGPVSFKRVYRSLNINMGDGDDVVDISQVKLLRNLSINLGDGNDTLSMSHVKTLLRSSTISGGLGDDVIEIDGSKFYRKLDLNAGAGDDTVNLADSFFGRKSSINGGDDTDKLGKTSNTFRCQSQISNFEDTLNGVFPIAHDDAATLNEGANTNINVSNNDTTLKGTLTLSSIVITTQPTHGTVVVNNDGTVTYTHDGSETTSDSFAYTIENSFNGVSNPATVSLTITPVNDAPVAVNDAATLNEGANANINVSSNDTDVDGTLNLASIVITAQPVNGTLVVNNNGTVTYTHNGSETTSDTFKYTIKDNNGAVSNEATVTLTITPVNDAPVANNDTGAANEGGSTTVNVSTNDTDADGTLDLTSIVVTNNPTNGTVIVNNDGTIQYTHNGSETTSDTFTYTIKDNSGATSNQATVTITITLVNDAPVANDDAANVAQGGNVNINLAGNDTDADGTIDLNTIVIGTGPANGTLAINGDGTVTYTHDNSNTTTDSFTYTIKDNQGLVSNLATVTITIA